jgi:peptide/nickel transport system substrate-binding protein
VVFTLERILDPQVGSPLRSTLRFIDGAEAIDDYTVRLNLNTPNAELPLLLSAPQARIVAHDYDPTLLGTAPSGTGPFRMQELIAGERIRFVRNEEYWDVERVHLAEVHHVYLSDLDEQVDALLAGEVDLIPDIGSEQVSRLAERAEIEILETTSGAYQPVIMQATERPFNDVRVRQALKYCMDRPATRARVLQGFGTVGNDHPVAPISPFWADLPPRSQNIAEARRLLAEAGYSRGLQLDLITSTARPGMLELAHAVREMAAPAGIIINVIRVPADIYWSDYWQKVPFHIGNWNFRPSIDETFMVAYHSTSPGNESNWSSPQLDEWIDTARAVPDPDVRREIYEQAQELIMEEGAVIIPYFRPLHAAMRKTVQGFVLHPAGLLDLRDVQIGPFDPEPDAEAQ